jgi:hypothetical protein
MVCEKKAGDVVSRAISFTEQKFFEHRLRPSDDADHTATLGGIPADFFYPRLPCRRPGKIRIIRESCSKNWSLSEKSLTGHFLCVKFPDFNKFK